MKTEITHNIFNFTTEASYPQNELLNSKFVHKVQEQACTFNSITRTKLINI